jgi:hypothetical protein
VSGVDEDGLLRTSRSPRTALQQNRADETVIVRDNGSAACSSDLAKMHEALLGGIDAGIRSSAKEIAWAARRGVKPTEVCS